MSRPRQRGLESKQSEPATLEEELTIRGDINAIAKLVSSEAASLSQNDVAVKFCPRRRISVSHGGYVMTPSPYSDRRPAPFVALGAAAIWIFVATPASAQERLQNPSFSSGLSGWTQWKYLETGGGTVTFSTNTPEINARGANSGSTADGILWQCVTVVPGKPYSASAQARRISASGNAHFFFYIVWSADAACGGRLGSGLGLYEQAEFAQSANFTTVSLNSTVPAGAGSASSS